MFYLLFPISTNISKFEFTNHSFGHWVSLRKWKTNKNDYEIIEPLLNVIGYEKGWIYIINHVNKIPPR